MKHLSMDIRLRRGTFALQASLRVPASGITAVYGPSGCGKTTLLRAIAGLDSGVEGEISLGKEMWHVERAAVLPVHKRGIGYVAQDAGLLPHLSVRSNLEFARRRNSAEVTHVTLEEAASLMGALHLLDRGVDLLSGGERQRVAIARALLAGRQLIMLDEPLASLDMQARRRLLPLLSAVRERLRVPMIYVTHTLDEVARLADRLVLMTPGEIEAEGPVEEMLTRLDLSVTDRADAEALLFGTVTSMDVSHGLAEIETPAGDFSVVADGLRVGDTVRLRVLARDVSLTLDQPTRTSILNVFPVQIRALSEQGPGQRLVSLEAGSCRLLARVTHRSVDRLGLAPGLNLFAQVKGIAVLA